MNPSLLPLGRLIFKKKKKEETLNTIKSKHVMQVISKTNKQ